MPVDGDIGEHPTVIAAIATPSHLIYSVNGNKKRGSRDCVVLTLKLFYLVGNGRRTEIFAIGDLSQGVHDAFISAAFQRYTKQRLLRQWVIQTAQKPLKATDVGCGLSITDVGPSRLRHSMPPLHVKHHIRRSKGGANTG